MAHGVGAGARDLAPKTTKPPEGGFAPTTVDPYGQVASAGTIPVAVTVKVVGVALVNFT